MEKNIEVIIDTLKDFNLENENYLEKLRKLTDELLAHPNPEQGLAAMFEILERYPDEELGSPGPLVHAIERCRGYEEALFTSLQRQPATLTVWMVQRLMKYDPRCQYVEALKGVIVHPKVSEQTREDAELILSWVSCTSD